MSVTSTDIVIYAAQNMPVDDTSTAGGAVNSGIRVVFDDIVATDTVSVSGSSASDTGNITITGRSAAGAVVTDTFAMSGTSLVAGTQSFERILIAQTAAAAVGTVRVQDTSTSAAIGTIAVAESGFRRPFYDATANAAGGAAKTLYEKCFIANNHATLASQTEQLFLRALGLMVMEPVEFLKRILILLLSMVCGLNLNWLLVRPHRIVSINSK
jgi:hypothetical protein